MQDGHGARHGSQALGEAQILLDNRRDIKTDGSEVFGADDGAVTATTSWPAAPHKAVHSSRTAPSFGKAKQQLPGLGGVVAADGQGSGLGAGGRELGTRILSTASHSQRPHLPTPSLLHLLWPRESAKLRPLPWRVPGCWRSSSFQQSSPESRQRDTNFARAQLRWAVKRDGPEVVVVIATEVAGLFLVFFSSSP